MRVCVWAICNTRAGWRSFIHFQWTHVITFWRPPSFLSSSPLLLIPFPGSFHLIELFLFTLFYSSFASLILFIMQFCIQLSKLLLFLGEFRIAYLFIPYILKTKYCRRISDFGQKKSFWKACHTLLSAVIPSCLTLWLFASSSWGVAAAPPGLLFIWMLLSSACI